MSDNGSPAQKPEDAGPSEHLNIKVTDNNNEVFFKIKRTTQLGKLMNAFCDRQGKNISSVRFLFEGTRVGPTDNPDTLDMQDGDTLEVHQEQIGGSCLMFTPTYLHNITHDPQRSEIWVKTGVFSVGEGGTR
ncbi:hypothetical protein E8E13_001253 [Curvularia kusanoi]|uniref:Ubiquitin-like domain-containing protein n=1 Tax=Curvularia kusanoi TaxID=90978 RepID=A0A9P4T4H8_CURKU|nr:hypothetical protein E8E13_001253 [Curvularia kusanoi]